MKANELRIGNLVQDENYNLANITHDDFMGVNKDGTLPLRAIPLTEEWLLKFGFKKHVFNNFILDYKSTITVFTRMHLKPKPKPFSLHVIDGEYCIIIGNNAFMFKTVFKDVNHLQNTYFDLTGEELTITNGN